jgi:hypothetical protein
MTPAVNHHNNIRAKLKNNGLKYNFRSYLEAIFWIANQSLEYEPKQFRTKYNINGEEHIYIPDFIDLENKKIIEIKPIGDTLDEVVIAKQEAIITALKGTEFQYEIITEQWFNKNRNDLLLLPDVIKYNFGKYVKRYANYWKNYELKNSKN